MGISYLASTPIALIGLFGSVSDISNIFAFTVVHNRYLLFHTFQKYVGLSTFIAHTGSMAFLFALLQIVRYFRGLEIASTNLEGQVLKPMFFPANTSHLRLFPKKHGFSYSYLLTGVPVGWTGSSGGMISVDEKNNVSPWYKRLLCVQPMSPWYVVDGDAYLERGHVPGGLEGKLKRFLQDQGLNHGDYPYAYLMTSSRFLGYQNNPVSIWNLYSRDKALKAVILEVNNTFDERHTYFVTSKDVEASMIEKTKGKPPRFTNTWSKEFYVSPFNSRSGSYSISASDPFFPSLSGSNPLDLTLTLTSTERAFLVARIFSDGPALDPSTMTVVQKTQFILSWWWVGFATFPRTLVQASMLFFKRSLPWVSRPEPLKVTISRHADTTQQTLEPLFRQYLQHLIETADQPLVLKYRPAGLLDNKVELMYSPSAQMSPQLAESIEISVFTPVFYTRFVKHIDVIHALEMESKNEIISISNTYLLRALLVQLDMKPGMRSEDYSSSNINTFSYMFFRTIYSTRIPPPLKSSGSVFSNFDQYILKETDRATPPLYQRMLFKMWLSDWFAFGWIDLLELQWWLIKSGVSWWVAGKLRLVKE